MGGAQCTMVFIISGVDKVRTHPSGKYVIYFEKEMVVAKDGIKKLCTASRRLRSYASLSKIPGYATVCHS